MKTLEDAWQWYQAATAVVKQITRLAGHWDQLPWELADLGSAELDGADQRLARHARVVSKLRKDPVLGNLLSADMRAGADLVRAPLDDLAILELFSAFEAQVRDWVKAQVEAELGQLRDPTIRGS